MNPGTYDTPITIKRKSVTQEPVYGTQVVSWVPLNYHPGSPTDAQRDWAEIDEVLPSRSEAVRQGLAVARDQVKCRIRWRSDVTSDMQITVHGVTDVVYEIVAGPAEVMAAGRRKVLELVLEKFTTKGDVT